MKRNLGLSNKKHRNYFQLRHQTLHLLRVPIVGKGPSRIPVVFPAIRHAALLHQFQHKFPAVRDVRHHIQKTDVAAGPE